MQRHRPPLRAFDPLDLAVLKQALDSAWSEIATSNLIALPKDQALKKAVCQKLFSLARTRPADPEKLRELLLSAISADSTAVDDSCPEHCSSVAVVAD